MSKKIDISSHKIMSMEAEKRNRIMNAAFKEFNKGYKKASTDSIVREAGISKGLLFHYFGSKENLYEFAFAYAGDIMLKEYFELLNFEQRDVLERLWQMILLKIDLSYKYPMMFDFLTTLHNEDGHNLVSKSYGYTFEEMIPKLFADIDETLFKDGIDPKMAVNIIYWTFAGYSTAQLTRINSPDLAEVQKEYDRFLKDIQEYLSIFRTIFYKE